MKGVIDIVRKWHVLALRILGRLRPLRRLPQGRVVILAPHPDDEALGCGGLIARLCQQGWAPQVVIFTGGEASHRSCCGLTGGEIAQARHQLTLTAAEALGLPQENITRLGLHDGSLSKISSDDRLKVIETIAALSPDVILVPHSGEGWPDHLAVREIGHEAARACGARAWEYAVWMWYYNVWLSAGWSHAGGLRLSPDEQMRKREAVDRYILPQAPCGTPWSGKLPSLLVTATTSSVEIYFPS